MLKTALAGILISIPLALSQPADTQTASLPKAQPITTCNSDNVPTKWGIGSPPVSIELLQVALNEWGRAVSTIKFRNLQPTPVSGLALLVNVYDDEGHLIESLPIVGSTGKAQLKPPFPYEVVASNWKDPLQTGEEGILQGIKDSILTTKCPATASVTWAMLQGVNGKIQTSTSPGWRVGPSPRFVPELDNKIANFNPTVPSYSVVKARLNSDGNVASVSYVSGDASTASNLRNWLVSKWSFHPALVNGNTVPSEIDILIRVHESRTPTFPILEGISGSTALVDLFPSASDPAHWEVRYGQLLEDSVLR
jgi:hypothetical protein